LFLSSVQMITTIAWVRDGSHLLCATDLGTIQVWDVGRIKLVRTLKSSDVNMRIAGLGVEGHIVIQGNRNGTMRQHDLRIPNHLTYTVENAHSQEVNRILRIKGFLNMN
jgi:cell division cycle 20-like protein 1 (cofactor of APC complex)